MTDKTRRKILINGAVFSSLAILPGMTLKWPDRKVFESHRPELKDRKFTSKAVENTILRVKKQIKHPEVAWLFENCFPNTLDTTVDFTMIGGQPDTYVITGDIDAMWLRDSTAQVFPYLSLMNEDAELRQLVAGVIRRQVACIRLDPYANAFYKDTNRISEWKETDLTDMKPGVHERKWEIDSLCYHMRLSYHYWKMTGDQTPFGEDWLEAVTLIIKTFKEQQRKVGPGPYSFQRRTAWATDGVPLAGYGYPVRPVGLICSMFRPSDDATIFPFLIPSNFFAVDVLRKMAQMLTDIHRAYGYARECSALADEVGAALKIYSTTTLNDYGKIYGFETNGLGSYNLMDDANVPSLLSLPYLTDMPVDDVVYRQTRKFILSPDNPFFFQGSAGYGVGGPHTGMDMIWPLGIIMRALTSTDTAEIKMCVELLRSTHGGTGFMHESFYKDDASRFTRKWFAWANTLFGELIVNVVQKYPGLI